MHRLAELDHRYIWHPFTQMRDWLSQEPIVIVEGHGSQLRDVHGGKYLDANSSIWTNLHGHKHPRINAAIQRQLKRISHSSALGFANEPASLLSEKLVRAANPQCLFQASGPKQRGRRPASSQSGPGPELNKVFFSDDGSTAMEVALKLAYEFSKRTGRVRPRFLGLGSAYHGDTIGAVSLGHIDLFHKAYANLLFKTDQVPAPFCYRCPFNRAKPDRADAREYRKCNWECTGTLEARFRTRKKRGEPYAAFVFEPLIQGAAGMIPQPQGWLARAADIARGYDALLIADEVMTGFGRTGVREVIPTKKRDEVKRTRTQNPHSPAVFACHHERVQPDFLALAKGLTGGYLPMAATLTSQAVFDAFLGEYEEFKTFFHGHSFTANQLGAAAALASLEILDSNESVRARCDLQQTLTAALAELWRVPQVGDIRQVGLVVGIELVRNWRTREQFDLSERVGVRVCEAMARRGVLTRPVGNVIVLMPPYCTTSEQVQRMVGAVGKGVREVCGG